MPIRSLLRAALCQLFAAPVIAITFAGCGGSVATSSFGGSDAPDAAPGASSAGCPSVADIDSKAAIGRACAPEGAYCTDPTCDPCNQHCLAVACTGGVWKPALDPAHCTDGSPAPCASIDGSNYDQTCQSNADCVAVAAATLCANQLQCLCPDDAINVRDQGRYEAELQALEAEYPPSKDCECPFMGNPTCVAGRCVLCGPASSDPGCPDGG